MYNYGVLNMHPSIKCHHGTIIKNKHGKIHLFNHTSIYQLEILIV